MILERQSTLEAGRFVDLQAGRQSAVDRAGAKTELAHFEDIVIDCSHRLIPPSSDGLVGRLGLIVGALIAASSWVVISLLPLPFPSAPSNRSGAGLSTSVDDTDLKKGDRLQTPNAIIPTPVSAGNRETSASIVAPTSSQRPPPEVPRQTKGRTTELPRHAIAAKASVRELESTVKLVPTPDTKPTTIEGWTLRDIINGTAVLEGPNGTWRVARGDTVPGLGKVESIFRWGNRLIVATSSGLVSTP